MSHKQDFTFAITNLDGLSDYSVDCLIITILDFKIDNSNVSFDFAWSIPPNSNVNESTRQLLAKKINDKTIRLDLAVDEAMKTMIQEYKEDKC